MGTTIIVLLILGVIGWVVFKSKTNNSDEDISDKSPDEIKKEASEIAKDIFNNKNDYVILDTETTGLGDNDVIVQMGIIDIDSNVLLDTLIKPTKRKRTNPEATAINGITMKMVKDAPTFKEIYPKFWKIVKGKKVLIYNNEFDVRLITQTAYQDGVALNDFDTICLMKLYSAYRTGDINKRQKLPGGDHSAIGDCKSALSVLKTIANEDEVGNNFKTKNKIVYHTRLTGDVLKPNLNVENKNNSFYSKKVVFTGELKSISRDEAAQRIKNMGADIDSSVTPRTDYVIIGENPGPSKLDKVKTYNIKTINEDEFLSMIK